MCVRRSFLRHAWCGLCAQYVEALNRASLNLVSLTATTFSSMSSTASNPAPVIPPLYVLLVNSGSPTLISAYRDRMDTPFPLYSDRKRALYKALGMTKKTWDMGKEADKGSYIVKSNMENVTSSIKVRAGSAACLPSLVDALSLAGWCRHASVPWQPDAARRRVCFRVQRRR